MSKPYSSLMGVLALAAASLSGTCVLAGSLDPSGAPGPTMKTLSQVEPRTPIPSAPYTITQSGSYYLATNLTGVGNGILIGASAVSLDLMGFTLTGSSSSTGILVVGTAEVPLVGVVVRNGTIRGCATGLMVKHANNGRYEQLILSKNSVGINLSGDGGQCNGNTVADCTVDGGGILLMGGVNEVGQCNGNRVMNCTVSGSGVALAALPGFCYGNTVEGCTVINGGGVGGIVLWYHCEGNTIRNCVLRGNTGSGISLVDATANRIEGNLCVGQGSSGIDTSSGSTKNLILKNVCIGQGTNYTIAGDDTYGPIATNKGALPTTGAGAHPWANFSR